MPDQWNWSKHARPEAWNAKGKADHLAGWFQVFYAANTLKPKSNATIQLRNHQMWVHSVSQGWLLKGQDNIEGLTYTLPAGNAKDSPNKSYINNIYQTDVEYPLTFHGWGHTQLSERNLPSDLDGILVLFEARSPNSNDLLMVVGADYYLSDNTYLGDAGIGRFKYVTKDWKLFGFTTATVEQLAEFCVN